MVSQNDFPGGSVVKNLPANIGDTGSILGSRRSPGRRNGNTLQYSCLGNSHGQRSLVYSPWGHKKLDMTQQLNHNQNDCFVQDTTHATKTTRNKLDYIKLENFCIAKETISKSNSSPRHGSNHDKGFTCICKIHIKVYNLVGNKQPN